MVSLFSCYKDTKKLNIKIREAEDEGHECPNGKSTRLPKSFLDYLFFS